METGFQNGPKTDLAIAICEKCYNGKSWTNSDGGDGVTRSNPARLLQSTCFHFLFTFFFRQVALLVFLFCPSRRNLNGYG
jgi:hypothetical protein